MCGFAGIAGHYTHSHSLLPVLKSMSAQLSHRGPDGEGFFADDEMRIGFCHRRLAIQDLSPLGFQPMFTENNRYTIVYNGEIYNHMMMRNPLQQRGIQFKGHSDTETLLAYIAEFGLEAALNAAEGMFAFALFDSQERQLFLVRDPLGIKPLYFHLDAECLVFASEQKAIFAAGCTKTLNQAALPYYLGFGSLPASQSLFAGLRQVGAGEIMSFSLVQQRAKLLGVRQYYSLEARYSAQAERRSGQFSDAEWEAQLEKTLTHSIEQEMISDVPLGTFLSGGIDSSLVTALAQKKSSKLLKTFCIGFEDAAFDESNYAADVAAHLKTDHQTIRMTSAEIRDLVPMMSQIYDEPLADMAAIPTYLLAQKTKDHVTVALSGDGGDELFHGYTRYDQAAKMLPIFKKMPQSLRHAVSSIGQKVPAQFYGKRAKQIKRVFEFLSADARQHLQASLYSRQMSLWARPPLLNAASLPEWAVSATIPPESLLSFLDLQHYLPETCLVKVDRATMAASLEVRVPLLNRQLIDLSFALPHHLKAQSGQQKWLLRQILYKHVPKALVERPKHGFAVPIGTWLRGPLRGWAEALLEKNKLDADGVLDSKSILKRWHEHQSGLVDWAYPLYAILLFQDWRARL